jgi:Ribose/xylose/arabinose/galactoside ABC-type transport systems, permease components
MKPKYSLKGALISNLVPIVFLMFAAFAVPMSGLSIPYLLHEMISRLARDSLLVLSLVIPVLAGMGLNFGMVLGAMAGQIGMVLVVDWGLGGMPALLVAALLGTPISIGLGYFCGYILNLAKGREMVTSYIIGFFMNGAYQFLLLYCMGSIIPITNPELLLSRGYGIRNSMDLPNIRQVLDRLVSVEVFGMDIPILTFAVIAVFCLLIVWFKTTKIGQDMRAVGRNRAVANGAGIPVEKTRILAIIISTLIACYGQIVSLQNLGTINTYNSHEQVGIFSIAAPPGGRRHGGERLDSQRVRRCVPLPSHVCRFAHGGEKTSSETPNWENISGCSCRTASSPSACCCTPGRSGTRCSRDACSRTMGRSEIP